MMADLLAGFLCGLLGAMGFGGGSVLILWLTLWRQIPPETARGMNLLLFLPGAVLAVILHRRRGHVEKQALRWVVPFGLAGAVLGLLAAGFLPQVWLRRGFGLLLAVAGLGELFHRGTNGKKRP